MVKGMKAAQAVARKMIESTYFGSCTIIERVERTNNTTKITGFEDVIVTKNQRCRLSFEKLSPTTQSDKAASVSQGIKLFLSPDIKVKAGSKIVILQDGMNQVYSVSGEPAVYPSHQEIMLEIFRRWS